MRHFRSALFLIAFLCTVCDGESPATFRRYKLGPLSIEEFRAKADDQNSLTAFTATRILYQLKCDQRPQDDGVVVTLTSLDIYAAFLPNNSWWGENANPELIDHEQGHFDIAEINVRKAKLAFAKRLADGRKIVAMGASADKAYSLLSEKIDKVVQLVDKQNTQDNFEYDQSTRHGSDSRVQREQRRIHQLSLKRLAEEMKKLKRTAVKK